MGLVTFTLDDLCAFFTSKLPDRLVVGLLDNEATAASAADVHAPIIIIQDADSLEILKTYSGFGQLGGDIHLQVQPAQALTVLEQPDGLRHPFSRLVDLERVLYQQNFHIQPNRCRTRLHFSNGRLYTVGQLFNVRFGEMGTDTPDPDLPSLTAAILVGLEVAVAAGTDAQLTFSNGVDPYRFAANRNYKVTLSNRAPGKHINHFRHFYEICPVPPAKRLVPVRFSSSSAGQAPELGDPLCMPTGLGLSEF